MIPVMLEMARIESEMNQKREEQWRKDFEAASPEMKKWMVEKKEKDRLEAIDERRHREQIRAQEKIADAIRSSSFWRF